ncbi:hypothetical protein ACFL2V_04165 [Pseudomonadota bacterium]
MRGKVLRFLSVPVFIVAFLLLVPKSFGEDGGRSNTQAYTSDAKRFCALFSPGVWVEMRKKYQGADLMREFMRRIDNAVMTPEFEAIMDRQHLQEKNADVLYQFYVKEVSTLTGSPFSCPDLKTYFQETLRY